MNPDPNERHEIEFKQAINTADQFYHDITNVDDTEHGLKYDGKKVIMSHMWVDMLADVLYMMDIHKHTLWKGEDVEDYNALKNFFLDIQEKRNDGN